MGQHTASRRATLYASTALAVLAAPAHAQLAPTARPTGGQVSAGQASIGANATTTTINQSSQKAAINWQTYNVGSGQTVQYNQPNAASFTLNRVIAAQPSQIAGHIKANGQIAIVNQSGVVFLQGSTVDTSGLVVSAAGITDADFMAGRMIFGAPARAGAAVSNAGNITIRQAGLAALVAPQVRNSGVITAQLGRVILGGATTHTLDMYGDGLVALNVTGQVTQVQVAGHPVTALVTNTGTVLAPGGTVVLTARAADGVVSTAVSAGGTIAAPTVGSQTGRVLVSGIGGDVEIDGAISATGSNAAGGQIAVASDHHVMIANGALLDASGDTAGGTLAIGTTAPVVSGPATIATATTVAPSASVRARALRAGHGGRIAIAASGSTSVQGTVTAQGGDISGDGGSITLSGATITSPGAITTAALHGRTGSLSIIADAAGDPLYIGDSCATGKTCIPWSSLTTLAASNTVSLTNSGDVDFLFNHAATTNGFSGGTISLAVATTKITGHTSDVNFDAGVSIFVPVLSITSAGAINLNTALGTPNTATGATLLDAGTMTLSAAGNISAGPLAPNGSDKGELITSLLAITNARNVQLDAAGNSIATLAGISDTAAATAISGTVTLIDNHSLSVTAPISATGSVSISVTGTDSLTGANALSIPASINGSVVSLSGDGITLDASGNIAIGAAANAGAGTLSFDAQGGDIIASGALTAGTLAAHATGNVSVTSATNAFASIGTGSGTVTGLVSDTGSVIVDDAVALAINRAISAQFLASVTVTTASGTAHALTDSATISAEQIALTTSGGTTAPAGSVLTIARSLTATGNSDQRGTITLHAGLGDIGLQTTLQGGTATAGIFNGDAVLQADSGSITEALGGAIHVGTLAASASGSIVLAQSGNQIANLGRIGRTLFAVTAGGGVSLTDGQNLNVAGLVTTSGLLHLQIGGAVPSTLTVENDEGGVGTLSVSGAGTIALAADHFALNGGVIAHGGTVALDVAHAGTFKVADAGGTIDPTSLDKITATTLALGSQDGITPGNTTNLLIDTGSVAGPTVLDLTTVASTLALFASGAITEENPGALPLGLSGISVATLRGVAGGAVTLASDSNSIRAIGGLTSAAGSITVRDATSLDVTGAITAAGSVGITVTPFPADVANVSTLTIGANVTGSDVTLTSTPASGPLASLPAPTIAVQSGATIAATGAGAAPGTITLAAAIGNVSLAGTLSARTGSVTNGTISLIASGGSIVEQATGALQAGRLGANASQGTLASGATTGAGINLASGTTAAGTAPVNLVGTLTSLSAVDNIAFTDNTSLAVAGPIVSSAGNVALTVDTQAGSATANTLLIGATTISGRGVALATAGSANTAPAVAITLAAGSTVSTTGTTGTPTDHIGTLSVTASQGAIAVNGTLTGVADGATPYFGAISLDAAAGAITEGTAGAIRASSFAASAQGDIQLTASSGTLSGTPTGNQIAATGAAIGALSGIATQGSLTLVDGTPLSITGLVSAGAQAAFVTPTLTLTGTGSLTVGTGGKVLLAANEYILHGGITATDGLVALGLLTAGTFSIIAGTATGNDEIGAADLAHISAGTLALGSTDGFSADGNTASATTWTASTAGSVALLQILAPLNSSFPTLGLFSNGAILATGSNSITAAALYGAAATGITLDATSNQIGTLVPLAHAAGRPQDGFALGTTLNSITLQDAHTLFVEGGVGAPNTVAITVTGLASAAAPNALHLDSGLNGQIITLATTGTGATAANQPQVITFGVHSSTVSTGTLSVTAAQGDIDIAGFIQATLGRTAEFQALAGNIYETDAAFDTPSAATTPTGHFLVSRLAAQAGPLEGGTLYSVILDSTQNVLNDVVGFANGGATQVSSATDTFSLFDTLSFNVEAGVHLEAGNSGIAGHAGLLSLTTGLGIEVDGTVQAGSLTTSAPGTAAYAGSLILNTQIGNITETAAASVLAGTLTAAATAGGVLLDTAGATNVISTLAGVNTAHTSFRLADSAQVDSSDSLPGQTVNVTGGIEAGTGSLILKITQGNLNLDTGAVLTAATSATLDADFGIVQYAGSVTAATIGVLAGLEVAQFQGAHLTAVGANGTTPSLAITGESGGHVILPGGGTITLFGIALGGTDVASSSSGHGAGSIVLFSPFGDISQTAPTASNATPPVATGTILADSLAFQAGSPGRESATPDNAWLNSAGNSISVLSGIAGTSSAIGTILLTDTAPLTIASGTLIRASNQADLPDAISIHDTASITINGTLQAGALFTPNATTSSYTGALTLLADHGDITEGAAGALLASTLNVNALSGNVALGAAANTVTSLVGSSSAFGNFTLADTAQVATGIFLPGQNVFITGPVSAGGSLALSVSHGNLNLEPAAFLTAGTTASLAADLGVLQFGGGLTAGTIGITAGSEVFQFGGARLTALGYSAQSSAVAPALSITAGGGFANDVILPNGGTLSVFGITLGGTDAAGTPTGPGHTTLIAQTGSIVQLAPSATTRGTLETGTLAVQAGTFESSSTTLSNVTLDSQNAIGTLSGLTFGGHTFAASSATGSIVLTDTTALTIAANTRIEAGNTANLPSSLLINESGGNLSIFGTLQAGTIHAIDATHGTLTGALTLSVNGSVTEGAQAALLANTFAISASGSAALTAAGNSVATLVGFNQIGTSFAFTDSAILPGGLLLPHQDVTIAGYLSAGGGPLSVDVTSGNLVLSGNELVGDTSVALAADLGIVQNATTILAGTVAITAGAEFAQFQNGVINATGNAHTAPLLTITAGGGFANDVILSNGTTITLFGMALGGGDQAFSGTAPGSIRLLSPGGDITQSVPGTPHTEAVGQLFTTSLAFQAGAPGTGTTLHNVWLDSQRNYIGTLTGIATTIGGTTTQLSGATGTLSIADFTSLTLAATTVLEAANAADQPTAALLHILSGDLTLAGQLAATAVILRTDFGSITQTAGSITAGTLAAQAGALQGSDAAPYTIALNSAANAIGTLAASSATGSLSLLDSTGLTVAAGALVEAGNAAGLPDALAIRTLSGSLSIAGTLQSGSLSAAGTYAGATTLRADAGDITEAAQGRVLTNTLNVNAPSGAVSLNAPANIVTRLVGANNALGGFLLTDGAASLPGRNAFIDGSITAGDIALAITGGNLNLEPGANLTSSSDVSLSADLGILQFAGTVTGHHITLSAGDEIAQFAHAALIATPTFFQGHTFSSSLSLQAGTRNPQAGFANDVVLPDGHTITLNGIALGGLDTATGQGVSDISLITPGGDITQAAPNDSTRPVTTAPPAATGTVVTDILHFAAGLPSGARRAGTSNAWLNAAANRIGGLGFGTIGAARAVYVVDGEDLALEGSTTLTAAANIRLTLTGHTLTQLGGDQTLAGGSAIIDAALLAQSPGALLSAGQTISTTGALVQDTATLAAGQSVTIGGDATQSSSTITAQSGSVSVNGALSQTGATLTAGQGVAIGAGAVQSASTLTAQGGAVGITGALAQSGRSTLTASGAVTITGATSQTGTSLLTAGQGVGIDAGLTQADSTLIAGQDVRTGGDLVQANSSLTAQSGTITVRGALSQTSSSLLDALAGGVSIGQSAAQDASAVLAASSVSIGAALTQSNQSTLTATAGNVTVGGALSQAASALTAGQAVSVTGNATQSASRLTALSGDIALGGSLTQSASALAASGSVTITGNAAQTASTLTATGGSVAIGGNLDQATSTLAAGQSVTIGGSLTQTASTLTAGSGSITIGGLLAQTTSTLTAGQAVTVATDASQSASTLTAGSVAVGGSLTQSASAVSTQGGVTIGGSLAQTTSALGAAALSVTGDLTQSASTILTNGDIAIHGRATQSAGSTLSTGGIPEAARGALTIGGSLDQTVSTVIAGSLSVTGNLTQSTGTLSATDAVAIGGDATQSAGSTLFTSSGVQRFFPGLDVGGSLRQTDSQISLDGALTVRATLAQDNSSLRAGFAVSQKGGADVTLLGGGALTQARGSLLDSNAGITGLLAGGFTQDGSSAVHAKGDIALDAISGNIAFEGLVQGGQALPVITLIARSGDITSNSGTLEAGILAAQAAGQIVLTGAANTIGSIAPRSVGTTQLAGLVAGGQLSLRDSSNLTLDHTTLSGTSVDLKAPGQSITQQGGNVAATTGTLTMAAGNFTQDAAGTLSAIAGNLQISSPGTLSFAGLIEAPRILLGETAVGVTLVPDTAAPAAIDFIGGTILTDSSIAITAGAQPNIAAPITAGQTTAPLGLFATATNFTQTGTTAVHTLSGEARQTVQFRLTGPAGAIAFDPVFSNSSGFYGLTTQLLLDLGIKGYASGNIVVAGLNVYYGGTTNNQLGRASLTGSVNGRTGTAAASTGFIHTAPGVNYQFNACPIQSLNCVLLSPFVVPLGSPVRDLEVSVGHRREDDDDLILPNVAEQDY